VVVDLSVAGSAGLRAGAVSAKDRCSETTPLKAAIEAPAARPRKVRLGRFMHAKFRFDARCRAPD
jgi:hypothetical protein